MKRIETERLILRPLTIDDAQDVFEWTGDPIVNRYLYQCIKKHDGDFEAFIRATGRHYIEAQLWSDKYINLFQNA